MVYINENLGTFLTTSGDAFSVNTELKKHKQTGTKRTLVSGTITGSSSALDCHIEISKNGKFGTERIATLKNPQTTHNVNRETMLPIGEVIYPGEELFATMITSAGADIHIHLLFKTHPKPKGRKYRR
jgi:hypothetical protein